MFGYEPTAAFVVRFSMFFLLFSTYPMLNLFLRTHILNLFFRKREVTQTTLVILNLIVTTIPLCLALLYPYIGTILAFTGAFAGFLIIYCLPVMVHLKRRYTQITNPLLAEAIALNEFQVVSSKDISPYHSGVLENSSTTDRRC